MELNTLRKKIDKIDGDILELLSDRMEIAVRTKKLKNEVSDEQREKDVMTKISSKSKGLISNAFSQKLFQEIMSESKRLQKENLKLIGFQGEHGAYSEMAVKTHDPNSVAIPCSDFTEVFQSVKNGQLDLGIVPIENSLAGQINDVNDLLIQYDLKIVGEVRVPVHHCLLAPPETDYREIKMVYSHPQALAQCRGFTERNKLEARPYYDTAGAAMMVAKDKPNGAAAIASKLCAELYDLEVLKENVEDHTSNTTRFVVLSKDYSKEVGNKCSIIFSTAHKPGALFEIIKLFYESKTNLTRIESRPVPNDPGKFVFLVDFQGSDKDKKLQNY